MKKILFLMLIFSFLMSCTGKETDVTKTKKLVVGTNATYAPFEYIQDGEVVGFDIDLINAIGEKLGYEVEVIDQSFDGLIPSLKAGKIDIIVAGLSATDERKKSVDFTDVYFKSSQVFLKRKNDDTINTKEDLNGKYVAAQLGSIQEEAIKQIPGAILVTNESAQNLVLDLSAGKVDAISLDNIVALEYLKNNPDVEIFLTENVGAGMAMALDKGKYPELLKQINEELKNMKENGEYVELAKKYDLDLVIE